MTDSLNTVPLFVDLDGTVIKSDLLLESLVVLFKRNPLYFFCVFWWLLRGRAYLKQQLAKRVELALDLIPLNKEFMHYLEQERRRGRTLILISASDQAAVSAMNEELQLFGEAIGSDGKTNLRANNKLARIRQRGHQQTFAYAGNSRADLPVWAAASEIIMVNANPALRQALAYGAHQNLSTGSQHSSSDDSQHGSSDNPQSDSRPTLLYFDAPSPVWPKLLQAMRPYQWLKNLLVFVPLLLTNQPNNLSALTSAATAMLSFCLCASSIYLMDDLLDLDSDRRHPNKRLRSFASGELSLGWGFIISPLLFLAALAVGVALPVEFMLLLLTYWLLAVLYSHYIKHLLPANILTLALLYTMPLAAGASATAIDIPIWSLVLTLCLFAGFCTFSLRRRT
ncbi:MAG: UbiA family prenyltransferase [Pseudohongiellaceae bacterium]